MKVSKRYLSGDSYQISKFKQKIGFYFIKIPFQRILALISTKTIVEDIPKKSFGRLGKNQKKNPWGNLAELREIFKGKSDQIMLFFTFEICMKFPAVPVETS
jgi:hypothetical protein